MSFLAELRRRNVIRMAGLYLVGAWLVTQVAATLLPVFEAPAWVMKALIALLAIGFVTALVFAWVFELTPDGLKRDADVAPALSIALQTGKRMDRMIVAGLVAVIAMLAVERLWFAQQEAPMAASSSDVLRAATSASSGSTVNPKSIAVLAFANMSADKDNEYFSDGVAVEILNSLAKLDDLKVAGRMSSFYYKGRNEPLAAIGTALGVAHVLEGSVRKQGERLRISAQLIRVGDGFELWSETFEGTDADVFTLQENIARQVTHELKVALNAGQGKRLVDAGTKNPEAYQLYLQASSIFDRRDGARMLDAVRQLQEAIAIDPGYARAYSRLAALHTILPTYFRDRYADRETQVRENARRAIALDPSLAEPWAAMGMAAPLSGHGLVESREHFEKAIQLDPDDITTNFWFGLTLARSGYNRAGAERMDHGLAVDPLVPNLMRWRGVLYLREGDVDGAEQFLKRAEVAGLRLAGRELGEIAFRRGDIERAKHIWMDGADPMLMQLPPEAREVLAHGLFGGDAEARARAVAAIDAYLASDPEFVPGMMALWLVQLGQGAQALELDRTRVKVDNSDFMAYMFSPAGKTLRALPDFPAYLRAKGFPALWDRYGAPDVCRKTENGDWVCD
ncbi:MAG TPA: hypothetical protein VN581_06560 [Patescibacteria group bacterium]|nr:hypothetical protein [Patescibacteria group bacterium]